MLILLPPSESKAHQGSGGRRRRTAPVDLQALSLNSPGLTAQRHRVITAVEQLSASADWPEVLKVSPRLADEVEANTRLFTAPTVPVGRVYTGVLYDALDLASLHGSARARASRSLIVISALFGALRITDRVPPYRLSMGVNLPGVGALAGAWRPVLEEVLPAAAGRGVIVDCRSSTYAAAWSPSGELASRWVQIDVPGATHHAKHTRGLVARALCEGGSPQPRRPAELVQALQDGFEVSLHEPQRSGRPWTLQTTAR